MQQNESQMQSVKQSSKNWFDTIYPDKTSIRRLISDIVEKYLGIPYKNIGRDLKGLDCYGLIINIYKDLGFELYDINSDYHKNWSRKGRNYMLENSYKNWEKVSVSRPLDVISFTNSVGVANHAGVVLDNEIFIHSCKQGTIISNINNESFKKRFFGFFRFKGEYEI